MASIKQILVATDFSESSMRAVDRGFLIAKTTQARYNLVHALGLKDLTKVQLLLGAKTELVSQKVAADAHETLTRIITDNSRNLGVAANIAVEEGYAVTAVHEYAEKINADLVLVGAQGQSFWRRFVLGSTASRLLRTSKTPVLVVKGPGHSPYQRVLIAVDFSDESALAIKTVSEIAPDAEIVLLHIFEVPFEGKMHYAGISDDIIDQYRFTMHAKTSKQLQEMAAVSGLSEADCTRLVKYGDPAEQIILHLEKYDCDLVVMGKHGTHLAEELLLGSVTNHVLAESKCDVLVITNRSV